MIISCFVIKLVKEHKPVFKDNKLKTLRILTSLARCEIDKYLKF